MPIIIILGILGAAGVIGYTQRDRGYHYKTNDMENLLRDLTGKNKAEKRRILRQYGRK